MVMVHLRMDTTKFTLLRRLILNFLISLFSSRITGGEPLLNLYPLIRYPNYDEDSGYQLFPFKTMSMLINLIVIFAVSAILNAILGEKAQRSEEEQNKMRKELRVHYQDDWDNSTTSFWKMKMKSYNFQ